MLRPDWTRYAREQIRWADTLLDKAERGDGATSSSLYAETTETLENVCDLIRLLTDADKSGDRPGKVNVSH